MDDIKIRIGEDQYILARQVIIENIYHAKIPHLYMSLVRKGCKKITLPEPIPYSEIRRMCETLITFCNG